MPAQHRRQPWDSLFQQLASSQDISDTCSAPSQLIFDDAAIHLQVGTIYVEGRLRVGSRDCRVGAPITITFARAGSNPADAGIIVRSSGQLDLHGTYFNPTWTRLSASIEAGSNWLAVKVGFHCASSSA